MKSPTPPKPAPPARTNSLLDRLDPTQRKVLIVGLLAFFLLAGFSTLLVAAAFYWALTIFFSFWQAKLETRMARDKARERERR